MSGALTPSTERYFPMISKTNPRDERGWWLALNRAPGLGANRVAGLLLEFASPEALFHAPRQALQSRGLGSRTLAYLRRPDWAAVDRDLRWLEQPGCHLLTWDSPLYPRLLREIPDPPPVLFVRGDTGALNFPQVAVVGSRNPTPAGRETAHDFGRHLAQCGFCVTSGLAQGIDAAAHGGALEAAGTTIAVAGCGPDRVYPRCHEKLADAVAASGAVITEFPTGTPPVAGNFPRRNRLISGLSLGVLVVEAALRSGSLITARLAGEQGREVFAVPGSIRNPLARGSHLLLRQGARLVETIHDILEEIPSPNPVAGGEQLPGGADHGSPDMLGEKDQRLLQELGFEPTAVDVLVTRTGLTADVVSSMLLLLELRGYVSSSGGLYSRTRPRG